MLKGLLVRALLIFVLSVTFQNIANAQPDDPDPDAIPLDPGTIVLVAAGVGYGVKKWRDAKQQTTDDSNGKNEV